MTEKYCRISTFKKVTLVPNLLELCVVLIAYCGLHCRLMSCTHSLESLCEAMVKRINRSVSPIHSNTYTPMG